MKESRVQSKARWLADPATPAEAELRRALDQAAGREADEVALRRVWARLAELPGLVPLTHGYGQGQGQGDVYGHDQGREESHVRDNSREHPLDQLHGMRTRRVRWPWIVAASLAGATATLAFMLIETKSEVRAGRVEQARSVQRVTQTSGGIDAGQRSTLVAPATVRTGFGETLQLALRGGTEVVVTSESTLVLDQNDRPAVSSGEVQFHVPHQAAGQTFSVGAGEYRVVVVGTRFRVRVNQSDTAVGVDEGVVEVWTDHRIARLSAGEAWVSPARARENGDAKPAAVPSARPTLGGGNGKSAQYTKKAGSSASASSVWVTKPLRANTGSAIQAGGSGTRSGDVRATLALVSPSSEGTSRLSGVAEQTALGTREAATPAMASPTSNAPPTAVPPDIAALALQARAARSSGDTRRALGLYRSLVQRGGPTGENAEYEMGRLLRDGLHQPREAISAWRNYRAQHPRGLLRIEADISVVETLISIGDKAGAIAEGSDFVRRYPDSERRAEIARLVGDLHRERGECADAVSSYDIVLGSGRVSRDVSDAASFHRSVCLLHTDRGDGMAALRGYLAAFPAGRFQGDAQRLLSGTAAPTVPSAVTRR